MPAEATRLRLVRPDPDGSEASQSAPESVLTDAQLVRLALDGDQGAFEALYRRHAGFALNLAVRLQGHAADSEDVVHDAFLRAHARMGDLRDPAAFRGWLGSIVVRLVHTKLRRRRLLGVLGLSGGGDPVDLDAIASSSAGPEDRAQLAQVYALLQTMPAADRIAWTLRYVDAHRLDGVAELSGCSLATAKRRIARAQSFITSHFVSTGRRS